MNNLRTLAKNAIGAKQILEAVALHTWFNIQKEKFKLTLNFKVLKKLNTLSKQLQRQRQKGKDRRNLQLDFLTLYKQSATCLPETTMVMTQANLWIRRYTAVQYPLCARSCACTVCKILKGNLLVSRIWTWFAIIAEIGPIWWPHVATESDYGSNSDTDTDTNDDYNSDDDYEEDNFYDQQSTFPLGDEL